MTATHTLSEAQIAELARAMRAALTAEHQSGYAGGTYVHDVHTHESILNRRRDVARSEATAATENMWAIFYDVMSRDAEAPSPTRCAQHPAFEADYCPSCGTSIVIGK